MNIKEFDDKGNELKKQQDNNPTIIYNNKPTNNRLNDIPVIRFGKEKIDLSKKSDVKNSNLELKSELKKEKTKYEIDKDTTFIINFGVAFSDERVYIVEEKDIELFGAEKHWVKFRLWNYMEEISWRQECMDFDQRYRMFTLNTNKFDEIKVRRLLLSWSFSEHYEEHKLVHINNQLCDESLKMIFTEIYPCITRYIISKMNQQLEK